MQIVDGPSSSLITDVTGFVAVDSTNRKIVVSFRGSSSVRNWLTNVDFSVMQTDLCDGCTVHQGFWRSWLEARPGILAAVKEAVSRNPGYGIVSTGHSLGGALATLCAATLRNSGYDVALVSMSSHLDR
jgi:predicted lipase